MKITTSQPIRVRFAPSPTGYLHIGSARTALFNWLFAKQLGGTFILRIEDTDLERSTTASVDAILESMAWLGLSYDEGPYYQSKHMARYRQVIDALLSAGNAYRCYCSKERLEQVRTHQLANKEKPRYDGHCRDLSVSNADAPFVIRFRNPEDGVVIVNDMIRGEIKISNAELDDLIIARSDGSPTYNFVVVVDDWDMKITHVIRGDDHLNNTPRQMNILQALGATLPQYAHVPMILGADGKRLSKRHGAVSVLQYRDEGYLPDALNNYLARLGWAHKDQEIFSREEMVKLFDIHAVSRSPAAFNPEKLSWLNQQYLKNTAPSLLVEPFQQQLIALGVNFSDGPALEKIIALQASRMKTLQDMARSSRYFFETVSHYDELAASKHLTSEIRGPLQEVYSALQPLTPWTKEAIHEVIQRVAEVAQIKMGALAQPIRVAITGNTMSPPIDDTILLIGKEEVLLRLERAIAFCRKFN